MRAVVVLPSRFATALALATLLATGPALAADPVLKTEDDKTLYALGLAMSDSLAPFGLSPAELEVVKAGLTDGNLKKKPQVALDVYGPKIRELAEARGKKVAAENAKAGQAFLDAAAKEKGAKKTASGLVYTEVKAGTGPKPAATDTVKVHYEGTLPDGKVFDSSLQRGEPAEFPLNGVIPCWTEGVAMMKVGGKAKLVCPAAIAYGDRGAPPDIKPGAVLVFQVELLEIVKK